MKAILLSEGARLPKRTNEFAAGYDLYVPRNFEINPGRNLIPLDIKVELLPGTEGQIRPRSGFSINGIEGFFPDKPDELIRLDADIKIGTIDEDYRGIVGVIIKSYESKPFIIPKGTKIAQMVISRYVSEPFEEAATLTKTERADKGFGHSGSK